MLLQVLTGEQFSPYRLSELWEHPRLSSSRPNQNHDIWDLVERCWGKRGALLELNEIHDKLEKYASEWDPLMWQSSPQA